MDFAADLLSLLPDSPVVFPAWESLPKDRSVSDAVYGRGCGCCRRSSQRTLPGDHRQHRRPAASSPLEEIGHSQHAHNRVGDTLETEEFLGWLVERGFERTPSIERAGEFSIHGGIIDIFTPSPRPGPHRAVRRRGRLDPDL